MQPHRHLTSTTQLDREWMESELFPLADDYGKRKTFGGQMSGRALYCLFYEPSFLTRTSFERAIEILGGTAYHTEDASQFFPVNTPRYVDNIIAMLASMHIDLVVLRSSEAGVVDTAAEADALPIINGGSQDDHPTQALADLYTLQRELGGLDGISVAVVGRLEHRNVSALLRGLSHFDDVKVTLLPFSGQADPDVVSYCESRGMTLVKAAFRGPTVAYIDPVKEINHELIGVQAGFFSKQSVQLKRGNNPSDVDAEIEQEREREREKGIVSTSNPANKSAPAAPTLPAADDEDEEAAEAVDENGNKYVAVDGKWVPEDLVALAESMQ